MINQITESIKGINTLQEAILLKDGLWFENVHYKIEKVDGQLIVTDIISELHNLTSEKLEELTYAFNELYDISDSDFVTILIDNSNVEVDTVLDHKESILKEFNDYLSENGFSVEIHDGIIE